jgi:GT2 family glycosyltransferase
MGSTQVMSVSVIVPAYDAVAFLPTALASIAGQTRPPDEVVVFDDGSRDGTAELARRWEHRLPLQVVRSPVNRGLGAARALAIQHSHGARVALLDADDYWMPNHLDVLTSLHDRHGGIVTSNSYRWVPGTRLGTVPRQRVVPIPPAQDQPRAIIQRNFVAYASIFDREAYGRAGGFRALRASEDWDLWIRMIRNGEIVTGAPQVTVIYRKHENSLSSGDGCTAADISILESLLPGVDDNERALVEAALRHNRARRELVAGLDAARNGDMRAARRLWRRAALADRSLRRFGHGQRGSVALRALLAMALPRVAVGWSEARQRNIENLTRH